MSEPATYVYDGECVLCSRAVRYVLKHDRSDPPIRFVAIKSELGQKLAIRADINPNDPESFIFLETDRIYLNSDAAFAMVKRAGGPARVILLFQWVPRPVRNWIYKLVARNRYRWFGQLDQCYLPPEEERDRFVLKTLEPN